LLACCLTKACLSHSAWQHAYTLACNKRSPPDVARALAAQAQASAQQGTLLPRERHKAAYQAALVQRFRHLPEVKRIERHRHLPAALYKVRAGGSGRRSIGRVGARMHDRRGGKPPGLLVCAVERQCHQPAVLCIARVVEGKRE